MEENEAARRIRLSLKYNLTMKLKKKKKGNKCPFAARGAKRTALGVYLTEASLWAGSLLPVSKEGPWEGCCGALLSFVLLDWQQMINHFP